MHAGASQAELAAQAAEDAAWTELQRCTAWWLGEFVNSAAGEVAGQRPADGEEEDGSVADTAGLSAAETLALKVALLMPSCVVPASVTVDRPIRA